MHLFKSLVALLLLATLSLQAQEGFYYQAIIKNTDGSPMKEIPVVIRIRIIEGETNLQYEEIQRMTTSREGFISFIVGTGETTDDFTTIDWQGELYLQDEIDTTGDGFGPATKMPLLKTPRSYIANRALSVIDNSITSASILDGSITADDLANDSITTEKLANGVITSQKIASAAVTSAAIAEASISSTAVIDSTLTNLDISPDAAIDITKINIPDGSITLEKVNLEDASIAYSKLNVPDGAIDFVKLTIPDASITYNQLSIGDTLIPYGKLKIAANEIPFEKLAITQENISSLGIISNYTAGNNISISEDAEIALADEISLSSVAANLIGDVFSADGTTRILDNGAENTAATFTGNSVGNLRGNLLNQQNQTILSNGSSTAPAKYFGDIYSGETLVLDASEQKFYGTLVGSWSGNLIGANNDIVLDPDDNGVAVFTGNVVGDVTGNVTGDLTGNVTGNVAGDLTGDVTGSVTGDVLAEDGTTVLDNGATNTEATFSGNAATATTLSETLPIEKGGTGATSAADARVALDVDQAGTINYILPQATDQVLGGVKQGTGVTITSGVLSIGQSVGSTDNVTFNNVTATQFTGNVDGDLTGDVTGSLLAQDGTTVIDNGATNTEATFSGNAASATTLSETLSIEKGGTGATSAADARVALDVDQAGTINYILPQATDQVLGGVKQGTGVTITSGVLSIGQSVGSTDNVTFNNVTATQFTGNMAGNVLASDGTTTIIDSGDGTTTATFNGVASSASTLVGLVELNQVSTTGIENKIAFGNSSDQLTSSSNLTFVEDLNFNSFSFGIGTDNPGANFNTAFDVIGKTSVRANNTSSALITDGDGGSYLRIYTDASGGTVPDFVLGTYNNTTFSHLNQLYLKQSTGYVGIGTNNPTTKLEVDGNVTATEFIGDLTGNADTATTLSQTLAIANGGTGATTAATARNNFGLFTGTGSIAIGQDKVTLTPSDFAFISGLSTTDIVIVTATSITSTTPGATSLYAKCGTDSIEVFTANGSNVTSSSASFNFIVIK